jgi:hypothetical protein
MNCGNPAMITVPAVSQLEYFAMKKAIASVLAATTLVSVNAMAALPTGVDTAFTDLSTDIGTLIGYATTAAIAAAVLWKVMSFVKRGISRV